MRATIKPSRLAGLIHAPSSKSSMQRALAAALITQGKTFITNIGQSKDDHSSLELIKDLGAIVTNTEDGLLVESNGVKPVSNIVNCGESGLGIRMFTPLIALCGEEVTITGEASLMTRPMDLFDEVLPLLGVMIRSNNGKLPLTIQGPLIPATITIDGSVSSQFLTGLLMSYSAAGAKDVSLHVKDLKSRPYIDLTLDVLHKFGLSIPENDNYHTFHFNDAGEKQKKDVHYHVEGDWSGGAFLLVAGAIAGNITVTGLDMTSTQADRAIIDILMSANAAIAIEAKGIKIHSGKLSAFEFDATDSPDLFPPLVALAANCEGTSRIKGVARLKHKESDRANTLQQEFKKMGVSLDFDNDVMIITGSNNIKGAQFDSHGDHRIAMACAVTALKSNGISIIDNAQAVNKSYPDFFWHLKKLGADVTLDKMVTT